MDEDDDMLSIVIDDIVGYVLVWFFGFCVIGY